jgi:UDP-perosamine 4-acetyltransferase
MSRIVVVGTGDHARVVADVVHAAGHELVAFVDPEGSGARPSPATPVWNGLDTEGWITKRRGSLFVVAIGSNGVRRRVFDRCIAMGLQAVAVVHPTAALLGGASMDAGAQVCAMAVIGVSAHVGEDVVVNTAATVDHDVVLEAHCFIGPGAHLAGRVRVGQEAHVGLGAVVREGITIGAGALVAAGAVVVEDVPPGVRVAGVPARPMDMHR